MKNPYIKKWLMWFWLLLKRQLKNKATVAFLVCVPLVVFVIGKIPHMTENSAPKIGIILLDEDELSKQVAEKLISEEKALDFFYAESEEGLQNAIINGEVECGYIFTDKLKEKLDSGDYQGCIKLLKSSYSMITSLSNEVVFSELFKIYAKDIAVDYVKSENAFIGIREKAIEMTEIKYDEYVNGAVTFRINFHSVEMSGEDIVLKEIETKTDVFPLRGILAILVYTAGLFGAVQWKKDMEKGVFSTMSLAYKNISRFLYVFIPTTLFVCSALIALYITGLEYGLGIEIVRMMEYVIMITLFGGIITYVVPKSLHVISMIPVFVLGSILFCPVFLNLSLYIPIVKVLNKLFIPYYYLV